MKPLSISCYTVSTACGMGRAALHQALASDTTGLRRRRFDAAAPDCWIGEIGGLQVPLPAAYGAWDCRVNRLLMLGLAQDGFESAALAARTRYGAARVGVFLGTSTSGVQHGERAYQVQTETGAEALPAWFDYEHTQSIHAPAELLRRHLGLQGCCVTISTACSSSAKVFASAARAIRSGLCDAAIVGGVDSLCLTTLHGFNSLQLISADICRPGDRERKGISIGEAVGFALLEPAPPAAAALLLGYGESADAYHMSTPDPEGRGAIAAMRQALAAAALCAGDIDYINLHGTATAVNDLAEDAAVHALFGDAVPCSSTKGWVGHTLGAAGIVEAAIALLCIEQGLLPRSLNLRERDPALRCAIVERTEAAPVRRVLSNSFGFGGNNCSLLFGAAS